MAFKHLTLEWNTNFYEFSHSASKWGYKAELFSDYYASCEEGQFWYFTFTSWKNDPNTLQLRRVKSGEKLELKGMLTLKYNSSRIFDEMTGIDSIMHTDSKSVEIFCKSKNKLKPEGVKVVCDIYFRNLAEIEEKSVQTDESPSDRSMKKFKCRKYEL